MDMSTQLETKEVVYPETDGEPMATNTVQYRWIITIEGGLSVMYWNDPNVFIAGDLFWYPVEGNPNIRTAPDVMVVFGRPKGDRGAYLQWQEDNIAPHVIFEVLSPGNRPSEMIDKFKFYEFYGVEEYYLYDPEFPDLAGWLREGSSLKAIENMQDWVSPRLGIKFELDGHNLILTAPDGRRFVSYLEMAKQLEQEHQQVIQERQRAILEQQRAEQLARKLRELGVNPDEIA